jgi:hypothetical protein
MILAYYQGALSIIFGIAILVHSRYVSKRGYIHRGFRKIYKNKNPDEFLFLLCMQVFAGIICLTLGLIAILLKYLTII